MLNTHSKYSLRFGIKSPEALVDWAIDNGYRRIALTDINNTSGVLSFVKYAQQKDFTPVVGVDIRNGIEQLYVIIAKNNRGFHEMNSFISKYLHQKSDFPQKPDFLLNCFVLYPFEHAPNKLKENEFIGIHQKHNSYLFLNYDKIKNRKLVILNPMTFSSKREHNIHRLLRAIDNNTLLTKLSTKDYAPLDQQFISKNELYQHFEAYPEIITRTEKILQSSNIEFTFGEQAEPQNIETYTGSKEEDKKQIQQICYANIKNRYPALTTSIKERITKEIDIIEKKGYLAYFLVTWDIINYAKSKKYFHVGRGSGANSIVAYLLGITDVDPMELNLYFERFINVYRKNPPDFDIDFSWKERDDVIQYIFSRFPNTALLCTYNTFQFRATVREVGKALGLPKEEIDKLILGRKLNMGHDEISKLVIKYSKFIEGLPSHLSIHAGGIIISSKPISWFTATFIPPKGFPTTQFSMIEAEEVGLYKYDILSQRGISKIHEAIEIIKSNGKKSYLKNIRNVNEFKTDPKILSHLKEGNAMGCFYIESPAMRMLMQKLSVGSYLELVAASSIIRPGVSSSGMMKEYILRHKNPKRIEKAHPELVKIMPETYGVMVYQEDVIKVAHLFAGLSLDEADILRRGMSGKYRSKDELNVIKEKFFQNCKTKKYDERVTAEIWKQIESFAGYAFAKGHSASFAVESFQSLYLKTYFPLEYMVAVINNGGGYYRAEIYIHEAKKLGAKIEPPEINTSQWHTIIKGKEIYLGFSFIKSIQNQTIQSIVEYREHYQKFSCFDQFLNNVFISLEQLLLLIRVGAFRNIDKNQKNLLWRAHIFHRKKLTNSGNNLFESAYKKIEIPILNTSKLEQAFEEMELLGFTICSPFELVILPNIECTLACDFYKNIGQKVVIFGYLISIKKTITSKKDIMYFGHFYDLNGTLFDTVHFPNVAKKHKFHGIGIYKIEGVVIDEFSFLSLQVISMEKINYIQDPRYSDKYLPGPLSRLKQSVAQ